MSTVAKNLFDEAENIAPELSFSDKQQMKILEEVYSKNDIEMKSDIKSYQVMPFAKGLIYATIFDLPTMTAFVEKTLQLLVSKNREGRKEFVKVVQATPPDMGGDSMSDRLLGVKG